MDTKQNAQKVKVKKLSVGERKGRFTNKKMDIKCMFVMKINSDEDV